MAPVPPLFSMMRWVLKNITSHAAVAAVAGVSLMMTFAIACPDHHHYHQLHHHHHHDGGYSSSTINTKNIRHGRLLAEERAQAWSSSSFHREQGHRRRHHRRHENQHQNIPSYSTGVPANFRLCGSKEPTPTDRLQMGIASAEYDRLQQLLEAEEEHTSFLDIQSQTNQTKQRIEIPVIFHVFLKNETYGSLTKKQVKDGFMVTLRKAYRPTGFRFKLKQVIKIVNATWFACNDTSTYKQKARQGGPDTLNVYICDLASKGLGGSAYLPPIVVKTLFMDGVNLMNPALWGADFAYQALVHEVGHWMGLLHTFSDGCDSQPSYYMNYPDYYFAGDGVNDTAAQAVPTWEIKQGSYCWQNDTLNTCPDDRAGVDKGLDPIDNYMNYLPANCFHDYGSFTPGQIHRMKAQYYTWRAPQNASAFLR